MAYMIDSVQQEIKIGQYIRYSQNRVEYKDVEEWSICLVVDRKKCDKFDSFTKRCSVGAEDIICPGDGCYLSIKVIRDNEDSSNVGRIIRNRCFAYGHMTNIIRTEPWGQLEFNWVEM